MIRGYIISLGRSGSWCKTCDEETTLKLVKSNCGLAMWRARAYRVASRLTSNWTANESPCRLLLYQKPLEVPEHPSLDFRDCPVLLVND